ncbi:uncharacterized protein [Asterias amurensis]|uniref:uncharacterized protein isoform X3 n=1 Tax=Asterias amurensis TaxID=7602 RepID=UPI003AB4FF27
MVFEVMGLVPLFAVFVSYHLCSASGNLVAFSIIGKHASQSTAYGDPSLYSADKAVDGLSYTFSHTGGADSVVDMHPWWRVDLGGDHCLGEIKVTIRTQCCGYRFTGAVARAGPGSEYYVNQQCGLPATASQSYSGAVFTFVCDPPMIARYVTLDIDHAMPGVDPNDAVLSLGEVAVNEYSPPTECGVVATSSPKVTTLKASTVSTTVEQTSTKPTVSTTVEQTSTASTVSTTVEQTSTKPTVSTTVEQTSTKPTVSTTVEQTSTKPTVSTTVEQTSTKPTVSTTVEQTSTKSCKVNDRCPHNKSVEFRRVRLQAITSNVEPAVTRVATSPLRCATYCASHTECTVFDFSQRYHRCHLHGHTSAIETAENIDFSVFELLPLTTRNKRGQTRSIKKLEAAVDW